MVRYNIMYNVSLREREKKKTRLRKFYQSKGRDTFPINYCTEGLNVAVKPNRRFSLILWLLTDMMQGI